MTLEYIQNKLDLVPEDILTKSIKNCHQKGLHSIVLDEAHGRLCRMFVCTKDHQMWKNHPESLAFSLGVHNHLYDIELKGIKGQAYNLVFKEDTHPLNELNYNKYLYSTQVGGPGSLIGKGRCNISLVKIEPIIDSVINLNRKDLHTVYVPKHKTAVWIVTEGFKSESHNTLITNSPIKLNEQSTYQRFSGRQEIINLLEHI